MRHLGGEVARASAVGVTRLVARLGGGAHLHTTPCDVVTTTFPVLHFSLNLRFVPVVRFATLQLFFILTTSGIWYVLVHSDFGEVSRR